MCAVDTCLGSLPRGSLRQPSENRPEAEESGRRSSRRARWEGGSRSPRWPSHRAAVSSRPPLSSCLEARRQAQPTRRGRGLHGWVRGKRTAGPSPPVLHSSRHPAKVAGVTRADSRLPPPFPSTRKLTLPFRSEFLESIILQNGRKHVFTRKYHLNVSV